MKRAYKDMFKRAVCASVIFGLIAPPALAAPLSLAQTPLYLGSSIPPQVMLDITKDQQLFKKAYNDYSDLDGDGVLETTYSHGIDYYGYFDSYKCYTYSAANKRFEPAVYNTKTATEASNSTANLAAKYCSASGSQSTQWSGNYLNWASMTRMDTVRKLLFGGLRSPGRSDGDGSGIADGDTTTGTVLERAHLPHDAHSFVKYYNGADITRLTPFTNNLTQTTSTTSRTIGTGDVTFTLASATGISNGNIVEVVVTADTTKFMRGVVKNKAGSNITLDNVVTGNLAGAGTLAAAWTVRNLSTQGISICNTTLGGESPQNRSQTNTNLPRLRVAQGNFALWSGNERWQCRWNNENTNGNGNVYNSSGLAASSSSPNRTTVGLDNKNNSGGQADYFVRIQACVPSLVGTEKCKEYDQNNFFKPIGLLQVYGDPNLIHFGLMTGSFNKNISGGVLRKNVGPLSDEVNSSGQFTTLPASGVAGGGTLPSGQTLPAGGSIIKNLSLLKIVGYNYDDGTYFGASGSALRNTDNCGFQLTSITQGNCMSWGNPMSEIYYESLRYFAGKTSATAGFTTDDTNRLADFATATWPSTSNTILSQNNYCAPLNILLFNTSVVTNENDNQIQTANPFTGLAFDAVAATTAVGNAETVTGTNKFFVGRTSATGTNATTDNEYCDGKTQTGLGNMYGVCPEGPTLGGSYLMAGLAHAARTNRIRNDFTVPAADTKSLKVTTYGIALASNVPQIPIKLTGETTPRAILQPAYRLFNAAPQGGGALVDMQVLSQTVSATRATGKIYINWEDSEQGGDYDQDVWGTITYDLDKVANTLTITTDAIAQATANPQGFGYIISGTTKDGPHFHSGIIGFNYTDPTNITVTPNTWTNASGGCNRCNVGDGATTVTYTLSAAASAKPLQDPLWYAAKWGGFKDQNSNNLPDLADEWDGLLASGAPGYDGVPDNYFLVVNPLGLEAALDKAFIQILTTSAASSAATNSTSLNTGSKIYQARFSGSDWAGQVLAFGISTLGVVNDTVDWDGGQVSLSSATIVPNSRNIITSYQTGTRATANVRAGIPFRWPTTPATPGATELPVAMTDHLRRDPSKLTTIEADTRGSTRLNYLRGDGTNEGVGTTDFRRRAITKLGDTVNANPIFVGAPNAGFADATYSAFRNTNLNRLPMLYTAANDGMLHVFNASSGAEVMAYVPQQVYRNLSQLTSKTYAHRYFIDASPEVQDAKFTKGTATAPDAGAWKTVLVGGLGGGGQGLYALDVTTPASFTEASANSTFLWTFDDKDDPDMGNVYGNVSIRKMANGKWAAIVGSGYNNSDAGAAASNAGQAETACTAGDGVATAYTPADCTISRTGYSYVFVIYLSGPTGGSGQWVSGTDYVKIPAGTVGTVATPNGLVSPFPLDKDLDGDVDYLYAGDLNGNLWKFDVSSATSSNWSTTNNQKILFTASANQSITSSPIVAKHVSGAGYMVNVGTGKYIESADKSTTNAQSYYGIWDKDDASPINGQTTVLRSELMPQWVIAQPTVATQSFRVTSNHQPNYTAATRTDTLLTEPTATSTTASTPAQKGWFFDFPGTPGTTLVGTPLTGERAVFDPLLISGRLIFTSILPTTATCESGGSSFLMVLNNQSGGRFTDSTFDANRDGVINSSDFISVVIGGVTVQVPATGVQSSIGITPTPTIISGDGSAGVGGTITVGAGAGGGITAGSGATGGIAGSIAVLSGSGGATASVQLNLGKTSGRISWREVFLD